MTEPLTRLMDSKQCKDSQKREGKRQKIKKKQRGGGTKEGKDKDDLVNGGKDPLYHCWSVQYLKI